jgi:hypothetical protein
MTCSETSPRLHGETLGAKAPSSVKLLSPTSKSPYHNTSIEKKRSSVAIARATAQLRLHKQLHPLMQAC